MFKVFSTFTGIGGFEIGIHDAAVGRLNVEFVGYSEIDKYAISVYERHFKGVENYGDITKINADDLPDFDCLVGGFPCQAFSIAGRRAGFDDTRGTLFFDLARILRAKRPRLFVFENVKGLLNHDDKKTFRTIIAAIDELGYDCQWQVLNSKYHGVPQNRERIIIVGHLRGTPRPQIFPIRSGYTETANPATDKGQIVDLTRREAKGYRIRKDDRAGTLDANYYKGIANQERPGVLVGTLRTHKDGNGFRQMKSGVAPTIPARAREDGSGQPVIVTGSPVYIDGKRSMKYKVSNEVPTIRATQHKSGDNQPKILQDVRGVKKSQNGKGYKEGEDANTAYTVDTLATQGVDDGVRIRRLTPLECERLQAFPDNWTKYAEGGGEISDTQRYKMCGNAVTTNVIQAVFERIFATDPVK